jgi:fibronectin-binding autotransporter adhesin
MKTRQPKTFGKLLSALVGGVTLGSKTTTRKNMKTTTARNTTLIAGLLLMAATLGAQAQATITKSGTTTMNTAADWFGGAPTNSTVGQFTTSGGLFTLGGNVTFAGLIFASTTPSVVTIANTGSFTNTLDTSWYAGATGITVSGADVTFNNVTKLNGAQAWNVGGGHVLAISGALLTTGSSVALDGVSGPLTGTSMTNVNGILGPWATTASGTAYATINAAIVSAFTAGVPLPIFNSSANTNYTVAANTAVLAPQSANTIQANGTVALSGSALTVNGILDPSGSVLTVANGVTVGPNRELVFSGSGTTTMNGVIANNAAGASGLTYNGFGGTLNLRAANNYGGNIVINSGVVSVNNSQNNGNQNAGGLGNPNTPAGRTVTINNGGILSLDTGGGNDIANGGTASILLRFIINPGGLVRKTTGNATIGPVTLNGGTLSGASANAGQNQYASYEFGSDITVGGNVPSTITSDTAGATNGPRMNLTINANNTFRNFFVADVTGDANPDLITSIIFANSGSSQNPAGLTKAGAGTMTLSGQSTYSGGTTVSNGTLVVNNGVLVANNALNIGSGTGLGGVTVLTNATLTLQSGTIYGAVTVNGGTLGGLGFITNNVTVNAGGHTLPGGGITTTIGRNLTYNSGSEADFVLGNSASGVNDQIVLDGTFNAATTPLSGSSATVGIKLTDLVTTNLDKTTDYVLITNLTGTNLVSTFSGVPIFLNGLVPTNAANFFVVTYSNYVALHFSSIGASSASASPNPALHNQLVTFSVNATAPTGILSVKVDASPIGGSSTFQLFQVGVSGTYTNSISVNPTILPGNKTMFVTITDNAANVNNFVSIPLTIIPASEVWNGASPTNTWATPTNWVTGTSPLIGDLVTFAGTSNNIANMESSYTIGSLTFSNNSGAFNITNAANTLTLTGGITNSSFTNLQILSVPIALSGVQTFNAVSNNLVFSNSISGAGGVTTAGGSTNIFIAANSYSGATMINGNLLLANGGALSGSTNVTFNNNSKLLLRADNNTVFTMATVSNFAQNAGNTLNFDLNTNLNASATGVTLSLTNGLYFPNVSGQTINVRGNPSYSLGLGTIQLTTSSHNPYFALTVSAVQGAPSVVINGLTTGDWGNYVNFNGGGNATITGVMSNTSNGSLDLFVNSNSTVTLQGQSLKGLTGDSYRYEVNSGTLVLDNSSALINNTSGGGLNTSYFILGGASNIWYNTGNFTPAAGVLLAANNSSNAAVYLGDSNNLTGGLSVGALVTNNVSDGDVLFTNSGVFTIGGQNTSGTNTYNNPIILGWTPNRGKSVTLVATTGGEVDFTGGIFANGTNTTAGVTVGDATHTGTVAFTGGNPSTYAGGTTVTNSILRVDNNSGSGVGSGAVSVNNLGVLASRSGSGGIVSGNVIVNSGGVTLPGSTNGSTAGSTLTISGNLTYNVGGAANFNLSSSAGGSGSGSGNDLISLNQFSSILSGVKAAVGIKLTGATLDTSDYTLVNQLGANFAGVFTNKPTFIGLPLPANPTFYSIVTYDTYVALHFNPAGMSVSGSIAANPSWHGQRVTITVAAAATGGISTVDVTGSSIPSASGLHLVPAGGGNYTASFVIDSTVAVGTQLLTVTAQDNSGNADSVPVLLTTIPVNEIWTGIGADNRWITTLNWQNTNAPVVGDLVTFAGSTQTTANMETSYTLGSVTFTNGAASFTITNAHTFDTLTLLSGVTNLSANVQTLNTPVTLSGPTFANATGVITLNAASNNLVLPQAISGTGSLLAIGAAGSTNLVSGDTSYTGTTKVTSGVLVLSGNDNFTGAVTASGGTMLISSNDSFSGAVSANGGTLVLSGNETVPAGAVSIGSGGNLTLTGAGQLGGGFYANNITNNGTLNNNGTNNWPYTGIISGTGGLTMNSPNGTNTIWTIGPSLAGNQNPYTYTGPTVVNSGELDLNFANQPQSGIYLSSSLTINSNGVVAALGSSALMGYTAVTPNLPVTINVGGKLTVPPSATGFSAHLYGIVNLNGGTLAANPTSMQQYGGWEIDNQVNVNGGQFTSFITDPEFVLAQTGGTVFNVTSGGTTQTVPGVDLDVTGALVSTFATAGTGLIVGGNGVMQLDGLNTYLNSTTISNNATLILGTNAQLNTGGILFGNAGATTTPPGATTYTGNYGANINNLGTFIVKTIVGQTLSGIISGGGTIIVSGSSSNLTLVGANTYSGSTIITNGTLLVSNPTGSATGTGNVSVNNAGKLGGHGGSISGNVTFNPGSRAIFNLDSTTSSVNNDQISFTGGGSLVTPSNSVVGINMTNGSLAAADYVLMKYVPGTISGVFASVPFWLGSAPSSPNNYSIVVLSNTVVLHYATGGFVLSGSASPNPAARNVPVTFTVTATGANPVTSVTLDASSIGGSSTVAMTHGVGNTWSTTVVVGPSSPAGGGVLPFTVSDGANTGLSSIALTVLPAVEIWTGAGSPNTWATGANWLSGAKPVSGDILNFAGVIQTNVNMEASYTIASLTFSNNAGSFNITNAANTLTVNGGITNNSPNAQTLSVPLNFSGSQVLNAAAGNITVSNPISGGGSVVGIGAVGTTNLLTGDNTYSGTTTVTSNTLVLAGNEAISSAITINSGTLSIAGRGQLNGGNYTPNLVDNGNFFYDSTNGLTMSGVISGSGGLTLNSGVLTLTNSGAETYSGPTIANTGQLLLNFANIGNSGLSSSSGLTINSATVVVGGTSGLSGQSNLLVTINNGGTLTSATNIVGGFTAHLRGIIRLNGGTLGTGSTNFQTFGGWNLDTNVVVNGGVNRSTISAGFVIPSQSGGTIFNVANGGTPSGIDLDITGSLITQAGTSDAGVLLTNNGTMAFESTNTYNHFTSIGAGATLILTNSGCWSNGVYSAVITNNGTFIFGSTNIVQALNGYITGAGTLKVANSGAKLTLSSTNDYAGGTVVNRGTLVVANTLGSGTGTGSVNVSGGTLGGSGIISGFVTNNAGGNLVPGVGIGVGTALTISNLTMLAGSTNNFVVSGVLNTNDSVASLAVNYGGILNVTTNVGDTLVAGKTFKLFNSATTPVGSFAAVNLPALGAGLGWNNTLSVNGSISVVTTTTTTPTIGNVVFSGGNLIMSGSNGTPFATYRILSTNTLPPSTSVAPWPTVFTGAFDANGNYIYTNPVTGGASFFRLATP